MFSKRLRGYSSKLTEKVWHVMARIVGGERFLAYSVSEKHTFKSASPQGLIISFHFIKKITPIYIYIYIYIYIPADPACRDFGVCSFFSFQFTVFVLDILKQNQFVRPDAISFPR